MPPRVETGAGGGYTLNHALLFADGALPEPSTAGTYFPDWLLERRKRAASALITVVADCYIASVSTHCMDKLVKTLGSTASRSLRSAGRQPSSTSMWNSSATGP